MYPALTGPFFLQTLTANFTANIIRNVWTYGIIFCGHFPDGAVHFTEEELEDETRAEWYLRQMLGSANFEGGKLLHLMSGQLGYQIEHHLFPDLPSNRYAADLGQGQGPLRALRHPVHDRTALQAVRTDDADDHEAVAAEPAHDATTRRRCRPRKRRLRDDERPTRRSELGKWSGAASA